jgi:hypothetical protein
MSWWIIVGIANHIAVYGALWWLLKRLGLIP